MLVREWEGAISDMPERYRSHPLRKIVIPDDCTHVVIYTNGSRTYHHGMNPTKEQIDKVNWSMSRCWDSIPDERKLEINAQMEVN